MRVYNCLPTGNMLGLIEVVQNAETLARIQHGVGGLRGATRDYILHTWMTRQQDDPEKYVNSSYLHIDTKNIG